eukprot:10245056-Karenia_brevis.AAC.1
MELDSEARIVERSNTRSGWRRGHANRACVRLQGPLLPIVPLSDGDGEESGSHPLGTGHRWHHL